MRKTIISVDPGSAGGIAWWHDIQVVNPTDAKRMPETRRDLIDLFKSIVSQAERLGHGTVAYTEKISGYIPDGGASQMFEFGRSVERAGCILETLGVRIIEVTPQAWQKSFALGVKGTQRVPNGSSPEAKKAIKALNARLKTEWKNKLKGEAQRRFPDIKVTLATCDALLILEYGMRCEGGGHAVIPSQPQFLPQDEIPLPL